MDYIIELADGTVFLFKEQIIPTEDGYTVNFDLPQDCVGFTIVDENHLVNGFPRNYRVILGFKRPGNDGLVYYYHNGNLVYYNEATTKAVPTYEELNAEFRASRAINSVLTR